MIARTCSGGAFMVAYIGYELWRDPALSLVLTARFRKAA
jgi:hypothetical protein